MHRAKGLVIKALYGYVMILMPYIESFKLTLSFPITAMYPTLDMKTTAMPSNIGY